MIGKIKWWLIGLMLLVNEEVLSWAILLALLVITVIAFTNAAKEERNDG